MISANYYVKVKFDDEGRRKIEQAIETIREVLDAVEKVGGHTNELENSLDDAQAHLVAILDKTLW